MSGSKKERMCISSNLDTLHQVSETGSKQRQVSALVLSGTSKVKIMHSSQYLEAWVFIAYSNSSQLLQENRSLSLWGWLVA